MCSQGMPPATVSTKQHAGISAGRRLARAPSVGTLTLIQHDLLIYFHGGNDVNGSILMPVGMAIRGKMNATEHRAEGGAHSYVSSRPMCICVCMK